MDIECIPPLVHNIFCIKWFFSREFCCFLFLKAIFATCVIVIMCVKYSIISFRIYGSYDDMKFNAFSWVSHSVLQSHILRQKVLCYANYKEINYKLIICYLEDTDSIANLHCSHNISLKLTVADWILFPILWAIELVLWSKTQMKGSEDCVDSITALITFDGVNIGIPNQKLFLIWVVPKLSITSVNTNKISSRIERIPRERIGTQNGRKTHGSTWCPFRIVKLGLPSGASAITGISVISWMMCVLCVCNAYQKVPWNELMCPRTKKKMQIPNSAEFKHFSF